MLNFQVGKLSLVAGKVEIKNAMDGLLRFGIYFIVPIEIILAITTCLKNKPIWLLIGISLAGMYSFVFVWLYIRFVFKDPDRLQTEKFQLAARSKYKTEIENAEIKVSLDENYKLMEDISTEERIGEEDK
jgi:membrane protein implicated in regulation of membrane protease activity